MNHVIKSYANGFTLLEILLAIALSAFLMLITAQLYVSIKRSYVTEQKLSSLQRDIRLAYSILDANISQTGFIGCVSIKDVGTLSVDKPRKISLSYMNSLRGFNSIDAPNYVSNKIKPATDGLIVARILKNRTNLIENVHQGISYIYVKRNPASAANPFLILADCKHAELKAARNFTGNKIEFYKPVINDYKVSVTSVSSFTKTAYFIAYTGRKDSKRKKIYGLYKSVNEGNRQELLDNVDDMHIVYGLTDKKGVVTKYVKMVAVKDWGRVKVVRISLHFTNALNSIPIMFNIALRRRLCC